MAATISLPRPVDESPNEGASDGDSIDVNQTGWMPGGPEASKKNSSWPQKEAIDVFISGDEAHGLNNVDELLLLSQCSEVDDHGRLQYSQKLNEDDEVPTRTSDGILKRIQEPLVAKATQTQQQQEPRLDCSVERTHGNRANVLTGEISQLRLTPNFDPNQLSPQHDPSRDDGMSSTRSLRPSTILDDSGYDSEHRTNSQSREPQREEAVEESIISSPWSSLLQQHHLSHSRLCDGRPPLELHDGDVAFQSSSHNSVAVPRSRPGGEERLDDRYYQRDPPEARDLLRIGRVFAVLRPIEDETSSSNADLGGERRDASTDGVNILIHVCRMIVVKEGHGFCWAIPINTYRGQGVKKRGLNEVDVQAHAIVHMAGTKPARLDDEPTMRKRPMAVVPASNDQTLSTASRINFAKVHTFEHNVKFMNIGQIADVSMPYFSIYWKQYL